MLSGPLPDRSPADSARCEATAVHRGEEHHINKRGEPGVMAQLCVTQEPFLSRSIAVELMDLDEDHSLLTGYDEQPPAGMEIAEGTHYNPYFINGKSLAMATPLSDDQVTYEDGTPQTVDQYARDVAAFLMYVAEPHLEDRKKTGFRVIIFMVLFGALVYLTKRKVWAGVAH